MITHFQRKLSLLSALLLLGTAFSSSISAGEHDYSGAWVHPSVPVPREVELTPPPPTQIRANQINLGDTFAFTGPFSSTGASTFGPGATTVTGVLTTTGSHTFIPAGSSLATAITNASAGSQLDIACGTYSISSTLSITNPMVLHGEAPAGNFNIGGTQFGAYTPCVKILWTGTSGVPMMDITNVIGVDLRNIVLDGGGLASIGWHIKAVGASSFDNLTCNNFVAGNANDSCIDIEGGDSGKANVQWNTFRNMAMNSVPKGIHMWTANASTGSAYNIFDGVWCTLVSGAGNFCIQIDTGDNNEFKNIFSDFTSGSTGNCVVLSAASAPNSGAIANYIWHPACNPNMQFVSNIPIATNAPNVVYGYDRSNGMPDVSGSHPESLVRLGSSDSTKMIVLRNQDRITSWNGAGSAVISMLRLDPSNNIIFHAGTGGGTQIWNAGESGTVAQFLDTQIFLQQPTFMSATFAPFTAGANDLGTTGNPFGNLWLGTAATNNTKIIGSATTAARNLTLPDADSLTPSFLSCGTTSTCAKTNQTRLIVLNGGPIALSTGTLTITSLPFTSSTSYVCSADDSTGINGIDVVYVSASSVTFNGTGTDSIRYTCVGN